MRTTITLDPDVELLLRKAVREREVTFKQAVNEALRTGLKNKPTRRKRFCQRTYALGVVNWDKALSMAAQLEDHEILRKMALGK